MRASSAVRLYAIARVPRRPRSSARTGCQFPKHLKACWIASGLDNSSEIANKIVSPANVQPPLAPTRAAYTAPNPADAKTIEVAATVAVTTIKGVLFCYRGLLLPIQGLI